MRVVAKRERRTGTIIVFADPDNVLSHPDESKPDEFDRSDDAGLRSINWELGRLRRDRCLGQKSVKDGILRVEGVRPEGVDAEPYGRRDVGEGSVVGVSLAHNDPVEAKWIGDVSVWMVFDDDL